jgi:hypothetical protein
MGTELVHLQTNVTAIMDILGTHATYLLAVENYQMILQFVILMEIALEKNNAFVILDTLEEIVSSIFAMENHQMIQLYAILVGLAFLQTTALVLVDTLMLIVRHSLVLTEILAQDMELALQQIIVRVLINIQVQIVLIQYASD